MTEARLKSLRRQETELAAEAERLIDENWRSIKGEAKQREAEQLREEIALVQHVLDDRQQTLEAAFRLADKIQEEKDGLAWSYQDCFACACQILQASASQTLLREISRLDISAAGYCGYEGS